MVWRLAFIMLAGFLFTPSLHAQPPAKPRVDSLGDPLPAGAIARLGTLRLRHDPANGAAITRALFSPDGKKIASLAGNSGTVRLWDAATGKELPGPWSDKEIDATAIAFSPDGRILAAAIIDQPSGNKPIMLWDHATGKLLRTIAGNRKSMEELVFSKDGKTLITFGEDIVRWWDSDTDELQRFWGIPIDELGLPKKYETMFPKFQYTFSPGGNYLAVRVALDADRSMPFATSNWYVTVFDLARKTSWNPRIRGNYDTALAFAFSPDCSIAAITVSPHKVQLHDSATGKLLSTHEIDTGPFVCWINGLALTPDGKTLAVSHNNGQVCLLNLRDAKKGYEFSTGWSYDRSAPPLAFSPNGRILLASRQNKLLLFDSDSGKDAIAWPRHEEAVVYVSFNAHGKYIVSGSNQQRYYQFQDVLTWDAASWKPFRVAPEGNLKWPNIVTVSPDQTVYVGKRGDGGNGLYDMATGKLLAPQAGAARKNFENGRFLSPGGRFYLLPEEPSADKSPLYVYDLLTGKLLGHFDDWLVGHADGVAHVPFNSGTLAISADGKLVAKVKTGGQIEVIEVATGKLRHRLGEASKEQVDNFLTMWSQAGELAFSLDGRWLASCTWAGKVIEIWDLSTGKLCLRLPFHQTHVSLAWSPDGRTLAIGGGMVYLWDLATNKVRREFKGHEGYVTALAYSPDGRLLASGSTDTTVLIWDLFNGDNAGRSKALNRSDLENHWQTLASDDAPKAFTAICELSAAPKETVPWIKEKLKPAAPVAKERIDDLVSQLDSDQYKVRQNASSELLKIGERVVPTIDKVLVGNPTLETRQRLQELRGKLSGLVLQGERLQAYRAVEVLERIGTAEARQLLQAFADGAPGAMLTIESRAALGRLKKA